LTTSAPGPRGNGLPLFSAPIPTLTAVKRRGPAVNSKRFRAVLGRETGQPPWELPRFPCPLSLPSGQRSLEGGESADAGIAELQEGNVAFTEHDLWQMAAPLMR